MFLTAIMILIFGELQLQYPFLLLHYNWYIAH
jgi:hypothetical protein